MAANTVLANTGIPMVYFAGVPLLLSLVFVVYVEVKLVRRLLHVPWWRTAAAVGLANVISTLVGVPIAMIVVGIIDVLHDPGVVDRYVENAGWIFLFATPETEPRGGALALAALLLLIPFYAMSALIEGTVIALLWKREDLARVMRVSFLANAATYACYAAYWLVSLVVTS